MESRKEQIARWLRQTDLEIKRDTADLAFARRIGSGVDNAQSTLDIVLERRRKLLQGLLPWEWSLMPSLGGPASPTPTTMKPRDKFQFEAERAMKRFR